MFQIPHPRRFKLRSFLIVACLAGALIGHFGRRQIERHRYLYESRICNWGTCEAVWERTWNKDRLVFLHFQGPGGIYPGGGSSTSSGDAPAKTGVSLRRNGLFLDSEIVPHSDSGRIWVYAWYDNSMREIPVPEEDRELITPDVFARLEFTPMWNEVIEPHLREVYEKNMQRRAQERAELLRRLRSGG